MFQDRTFALIATALIATASISCVVSTTCYAQQSAKGNAPLIVVGTVKQVFRSTGQNQTDYVVQIEVSRPEARAAESDTARSPLPGPGEPLYVHVSEQPESQANGSLASRKGLPSAGTRIRAFLTPRPQGGWGIAAADWYDLASESAAANNSDNVSPHKAPRSEAGTTLGMTTELTRTDGRNVLRVTSVERGGPAQSAGLQVGDIIAAAGGAEISAADQLVALAAKGEKVPLVVIDVNSGRSVRIEVDPQAWPAKDDPVEGQNSRPPRVSLGLSAEPVTLGMRSALKVIRVDPAGPAAKAGLEPGDIVVAANGAPTTGVEQLLNALRKSGPTLKLTVRDSRTARDVDVEVSLTTTASAPAEVESPVKPANTTMGAVTELAFHDNDFAVKVTEVEPGSTAARAGLRPGILIVAADGKRVLHPNDLSEAVHKATKTLRLTIVEPSSGRKSSLDVSLQ
jgi:S1-C subfamily serine protease